MLRRRTFVTGQPRSGKTTLVLTIAQALIEKGVRCRGFCTEECLRGGKRIGFDIVTIPHGVRAPLARKGGPKQWPKVGAYSVDVASFERVAIPTVRLPSSSEKLDLIICDEVGRMELKSQKFMSVMRAILSDKRLPVFGAVTAPRYGHRVPFCDEIERVEDVVVHNITKKNRVDTKYLLLSLLIKEYCSKDKNQDVKISSGQSNNYDVQNSSITSTPKERKSEDSKQIVGTRKRIFERESTGSVRNAQDQVRVQKCGLAL